MTGGPGLKSKSLRLAEKMLAELVVTYRPTQGTKLLMILINGTLVSSEQANPVRTSLLRLTAMTSWNMLSINVV